MFGCVCAVFHMFLSLMGGRTPKFGTDLEGVYTAPVSGRGALGVL